MINEKNLMRILNTECEKISHKIHGYQYKLSTEIENIVKLENEHKLKTIPIQKSIKLRCQILGKFIAGTKS